MSSPHSQSQSSNPTSQGGKRPYYMSPSADELKERGNQCFTVRKYEDAIRCYSAAIQKNPCNPVFYTNRALTHMRPRGEPGHNRDEEFLQWNDYDSELPLFVVPSQPRARPAIVQNKRRFEDVAADCRAALEIESNSIKGHFFLGQALCELDMMDDGVKHLQRAVDVAKEQRLNFGDELTQILRNWRKRRFSIQEEKRLGEEIELQSYLGRLIREDRERQIDIIKEDFPEANSNVNDEELNKRIVILEKFSDKCMSEMNDIFAKIDDRRRKREVPDYLCGKISFEVLRDPVVTPSGITYERKDIEEHLMRVGHFDPITRVNLTADQLIPNYAMKEVVDSFLTENEWALDY